MPLLDSNTQVSWKSDNPSPPDTTLIPPGAQYGKLLVSSAHYVLGPFGSDSDLRGHGEKIASRGGKNAKKRAAVAVARKLSVLLHSLWVSEEVYEPLRNTHRLGGQAA